MPTKVVRFTLAMGLSFDKYQGAGNDFLVVEANAETAISSAVAAKLCDRRFGVGGDGVLLVLPPLGSRALARMRVINADGSVPEMCGNGLRCVAAHLAAKHNQAEFTVETDAGEKLCVVSGKGERARVRIDMGAVVLGEMVTIVAFDKPRAFRRVTVGNPHAVTFEPEERGVIEVVGPLVEKHALFPGGTNVEFARATKDGIDLVVWERGVGVTHACGTGACATVAVAVARGDFAAGEIVCVRLPGGNLSVSIAEDGRATLEGPAARVFSGTSALSSEGG